MARLKRWDVYLDNQEWFTFCVIARYAREALRRANRTNKFSPWKDKKVTGVIRSPKG